LPVNVAAVRDAVAAQSQPAGRDAARVSCHRDAHGNAEVASGGAEQHIDFVGVGRGHDEIGIAVEVEVGGGDVEWSRADGVAFDGEASAGELAVHEHVHSVRGRVGRGKVGRAVEIEVGGEDSARAHVAGVVRP
jgi:hypothetical protein